MLFDLIVAMAITIAVLGAVFQLLNPAHSLFDIGLEQADMQHRARGSIEAMVRDVHLAGAGAAPLPLAPYRRGQINPDPPGSAFVDRLSVAYLLPKEIPVLATYWTRTDRDGTPQLMKYDGSSADLPVSDFVSRVRLTFFDGEAREIDLGRFTDGPWMPDAVSPARYDADLQTIRRVRIELRIRAARQLLRTRVRDYDVAIDAAPRNMGAS
jgi:hypothetical protein